MIVDLFRRLCNTRISVMTAALFLLLAPPDTMAKLTEEESVAVSHSEALQGGLARLPCDVTPPLAGDKVYLVIWYKDGVISPIYSFDSRNSAMSKGIHWADENSLGGRAFFQVASEPPSLALESTKGADSGIYRCRVDFQKSPTRNTKVNLTVIIPPEKLSILDEHGSHIPHYILGPYNEGATVEITCVATGGKPVPRVSWWQENALLDDTDAILSERRVKNVLRLERLQRKHLHSVFTCQASNNNLTAPISSAVTLDMNLRPLWVKLQGDNRPLSADNSYELWCEVVGARPAPVVTWWKGSVPMRNTRELVSPDGNTTTSILTFVPSIDDGGKYMSCRGVQSLIPDSGLEDGWKIDIYHVPVVTLELGSNLNSTTIREGADVYFECNIKSNPWVYKVSWRHNGKILHNNVAAGTIVSNQSLVLQNVGRSRTGLYTCVGSNQEGDGESNPVQLEIKFSPICRPGQSRIYGIARQEHTSIACELEANPTDVNFTWRFNNSIAESVDLPASQVSTDKARSIAHYTPMTEQDYGTLLCWGTNEVGTQIEPCVFYVNPAGKPDALANCTMLNQTAESLHVECVEGFDGGLPQEFVMEVFTANTHQLVSSVTSRTPLFSISGLDSGLGFDIVLAAVNKKGRSDLTLLHAYTLKSAERHTALTRSILHMTPFLGALIGSVGLVVFLVLSVVLVIRLSGNIVNKGVQVRFGSSGSLNGAGARGIMNKDTRSASNNSLEEKNPDIIPQGEDDYTEDEKAFEWLNTAPPRVYATAAVVNNQYMSAPEQYMDGVAFSMQERHGSNLVHGDITNHRITAPGRPRTTDDITYAALTLKVPSQKALYSSATLGHSRHTISGTLGSSHKHEPTIYAQIGPSTPNTLFPDYEHNLHAASTLHRPMVSHYRTNSSNSTPMGVCHDPRTVDEAAEAVVVKDAPLSCTRENTMPVLTPLQSQRGSSDVTIVSSHSDNRAHATHF